MIQSIIYMNQDLEIKNEKNKKLEEIKDLLQIRDKLQ
jgi:hypothetical protein